MQLTKLENIALKTQNNMGNKAGISIEQNILLTINYVSKMNYKIKDQYNKYSMLYTMKTTLNSTEMN